MYTGWVFTTLYYSSVSYKDIHGTSQNPFRYLQGSGLKTTVIFCSNANVMFNQYNEIKLIQSDIYNHMKLIIGTLRYQCVSDRFWMLFFNHSYHIKVHCMKRQTSYLIQPSYQNYIFH